MQGNTNYCQPKYFGLMTSVFIKLLLVNICVHFPNHIYIKLICFLQICRILSVKTRNRCLSKCTNIPYFVLHTSLVLYFLFTEHKRIFLTSSFHQLPTVTCRSVTIGRFFFYSQVNFSLRLFIVGKGLTLIT